jgi:hypothetical protein
VISGAASITAPVLAATAIATINNPATTVLPARLTNSFADTFLVTRLEFDLAI